MEVVKTNDPKDIENLDDEQLTTSTVPASVPVSDPVPDPAPAPAPDPASAPVSAPAPAPTSTVPKILGYIPVDCVPIEGAMKGTKVTLMVPIAINAGSLEAELTTNYQGLLNLVKDTLEKSSDKYTIIRMYNFCLGEYIEPIFTDSKIVKVKFELQ